MKRRNMWAGALALGATAFAASCYNWDVWDKIFDPATSPNGWYVGDGAISVPLPACVPGSGYTCKSSNKRTLWMFGDTLLDPNATSGQGYMVNNTIAVQERQDGEPPQESSGEISFWARRWTAAAYAFGLADVTTSVPSFASKTQQNMAGFMLNGDELDPSLNAAQTIFTWGASGVYIPNDGTADGKVVLFYEPTKCHGPANSGSDYVACRQTYDPLLEFLGERLLTISNPSATPLAWSMTTTDLGAVDRFSGNIGRIRWGTSSLYDDPYIYIYGHPATNDPATRDVDESGQVKLASATAATIGDYTKWSFLVPDGNGWIKWQTGAPAKVSDLITVANDAANIFSVHKVTYKGVSRYVMVEPIGASTHGVLRVSTTPLLWPDYARPIRDPATGQFGIPSRNDAQGKPVPAGASIVIGNVAGIEPDLAGFARDFRAHPELRGTPTVPDANLLISYEVDAFKTTGSSGGGMGKMRFTKWSLDWTYPWCAKGTDANGDGIGDDISACIFCGNGVRESLEDCDPSAPAASRFDLAKDSNGNGKLDCGDVAAGLTLFGAKSPSTSTTTALTCNSMCMLDMSVCLPLHKCSYDSECAQGQTCECYPTIDDCKCSSTGWSAWSSRDTPNASGDYESIADAAAAGVTCPAPTGIGCRRRSDGKDYRQTGENVTCNTSYGFYCRNADQTDAKCDDYEARFFCAPTRWFDRDTPNATGDYETLANLRATNDACDKPVAVECRRTSDHADAATTGEILTCNTTKGFQCLNADQTDRKCDNYEVRFYCGN